MRMRGSLWRVFLVSLGCSVLFGVFAACLALCFPEQVLGPIGRFLVVRDEPVPSDAIIVLLGESGHERTNEAFTLYKQGIAPIMVFPESFRRAPVVPLRDPARYPREDGGKDYQRRLIKHGVPSSAIRIFKHDGVHDTSSELEADAVYLRALGVHSVTLVSSASHSRRVSIIWHRVAPDIPGRTIGASNAAFERWWRSPRGRRMVAYEYGALMKEAFRRLFAPIESFLLFESSRESLRISDGEHTREHTDGRHGMVTITSQEDR